MRKVFVTVLALALFCWGLFLFAFAEQPSAQAIQPVPIVRHVQPVALKSTPTPTPSLPPTLAGDNVQATVPANVQGSVFFRGSRALHEVALTFDDGPHPLYTLQVLNILQWYGVKATFFCIGRQVPNYEAIVRRVSQAGNEIAGHTWDHFDLTKLSVAAIQSQLRRTSAVIRQITGLPQFFFRPPYGAIDSTVKAVATRLGLLPVLWNVDPNDWQRPGTEAIVRSVLVSADNGSVILMHDGGGDRSQTMQALPQIITALRQRGFKFVTVQRLVADTARI